MDNIFTKTELITLRRFFNRGVRCAEENHDNYEDPVCTYNTAAILEKLNQAKNNLDKQKPKHTIKPDGEKNCKEAQLNPGGS